MENAYNDLGYKTEIRYTTAKETPELEGKAGTAYISETGVHTIIINMDAKENQTKVGLISTIAEEGSHVVNGVEGRIIETETDEKGLESTGRAANAYFADLYKDSTESIILKSEGTIDTSKLGTNVGDRLFTKSEEEAKKLLNIFLNL